ncbi:hypothetical protein RB600_000462 [Gaeumannomyces tritici]
MTSTTGSGATSTPGQPHTTSLDRTRPGATRASPSTRGPRDALTPASGSGSGANKTVPTDTARAALGRQKSGDDRVQKRPATAAAAAATQVNSSTPSAASIAGVYEVMSDTLRAGWPDVTGDMWLRVAPARDAAGVYVASFDFGVLEGLMLIGTDRDAIRACSRALDGGPPGRRCRRGVYQGPDLFLRRRGREEEEEGVKPAVPVRYMLYWRGVETGKGEVDCGDFWGELKFVNAGLGRFVGEMEIGFVF